MREIWKSFPGAQVLRGVSLRVHEGEVVALLGENGAGKSTLMKILAGLLAGDRGTIHIAGTAVRMDSVAAAQEAGIALIHQELNLADNLDVTANFFLGREHCRRGFLDEERMECEAAAALIRVGAKFSPRALVSALSIAEQQLIEIAKALGQEARLLVMDEPTSSLSQTESEHLFALVEELREKGVSIIYISHRLGEVSRLADRALVLRDGQLSGELDRSEFDHDRMVSLMVGREFESQSRRTAKKRGAVALEVEDLVVAARPESRLSFALHRGEIVGLAGLVGAGRSELLRTLFGIDPAMSGVITIDGRVATVASPQQAIRAGIGLVPEDRKHQGLFLEMSVRENLTISVLQRDSFAGFIDTGAEYALVGESMTRLQLQPREPERTVGLLSGGNQQKVVIARWLALKPRVLLLDEPTRGIDVGARQEIYSLIEDLADQGVAILFASSEMEEVLHLADRVLVLAEGHLAGSLDRAALTEEAVMQLATRSFPCLSA